MEETTIAAISTAMSASGIGIVRISGPEAFEIASGVYRTNYDSINITVNQFRIEEYTKESESAEQ